MEKAVSRRLRTRDEHKTMVPQVHNQKTTKKTNAQYQKDYRDRIKANKDLYDTYRKYETLRVKSIRASMTPEQRERYNEKARIRNQRYRERQREDGFTINRKLPQTRKATENQREKWRIAKKQQRDNMNPQKKRRINEKRRERYASKKQVKVLSSSTASNTSSTSQSDLVFPSAAAKRKAVSRSLKVLPKNPQKFADVLSTIIKRTTPTKRATLKQHCILSPNSKRRLEDLENAQVGIKDRLEHLKKRRNAKDNKLRRIIHSAVLAKGRINRKVKTQLNLSRKITKQLEKNEDIIDVKRKERKDALPDDVVDTVTGFYGKVYIARELPAQRSVKKDMSVRKALECSMKSTYDKYIAENPDKKISYSKFASLKPDNVLPMTKHKYLQCLCEYCINIDFKVKSLRTFCIQKELPVLASDRYEMSRSTLCPKEGEYYKKECLDRNCKDCGVTRLQVGDLLRDHKDTQISWQKWEQDEKVTNGVSKKYMALKCCTGSIMEFIAELKKQLAPFSKHLFNAYWQGKQFEYLRSNVPDKWVVMCMDFGENYCCRHQDEAQSAHWTYEQVTLHPIVTYHRCPEEGCDEVMHHSLIFISSDHKHDYHMVHHMVTKANEFLFQSGINIEKEIHFSDGAPTQYKCKYNFVDMSFGQEDYGFQVEKHFFGSRHGKGPCDGEIGVLKRSASLAVSSRRAVISNTVDFYNYASKTLTIPKENENSHCHRKRSFFLVELEDVNRCRPNRTEQVKTLKDSRSLHSFRGIQECIVTSRERSCFCDVCVESVQGVCQYSVLTGNWKTSYLRTRPRQPRNSIQEHIPGDINPPEDPAPANNRDGETEPVTMEPQDNSLEADVPVSPATDAPVSPAADAPVSPATDAPVSPATDAPVSPATDAPVSPATDAPVSSATDAPVSPATDAPVSPATDAPVSPVIHAPVPPAANASVPDVQVPDVINDPILQTSTGADDSADAPKTLTELTDMSYLDNILPTHFNGDDLDMDSSFDLTLTSSLLDLISSSPDKSKSRSLMLMRIKRRFC